MKKVKIMLMSIGLIAITGGVLAFKAITPRNYCTTEARTYTTQVGGPTIWTCTNAVGNFLDCGTVQINDIITTTFASSNFFCYTLADAIGEPCADGRTIKKCPVKGIITTEP